MQKIISIASVFVMVAAALSGCVGTVQDVQDAEHTAEKPFFDTRDFMETETTNTDSMIFIEKIPELAPMVAPLAVRRTTSENKTILEVTPIAVYGDADSAKVLMEQFYPNSLILIGDVPITEEEIPVPEADIGSCGTAGMDYVKRIGGDDLTSISLAIAEKIDNPEKTALLFNDYGLGLSVSSLASYLNAPLIYTDSVDAVSGELANLGIISTISLGDVDGGDLRLESEQEITGYFLDTLAKNGDYSDYMVVVNTNDVGIEGAAGKYPQDSFSMSGAFLAAFRNAVIIPVDMEIGASWVNEEGVAAIKDAIIDSRVEMLTRGMIPEYLCLVGDPKVLPMGYHADCGTGEYAEELVPGDNVYGDFDGNVFTQELSVGRIVGRNAADASSLVARTMGYERMVNIGIAMGGIEGSSAGDWINSAYVLQGTFQLELYDTVDVAKVNKMLLDGGFLTKFRWAAMAVDPIAQQEIYDNNYVIYYGHGGEDGWGEMGVGGVDQISIDARDFEGITLPPCNTIAASCLTSRLDAGLGVDEYISLAFLHAGSLSYMGATRVSWFETKATPTGESSGNTLLTNRYIENLVRYNHTIGYALKIAKNEYYGIASNMDRTTVYVGEDVETYEGLTPWDARTLLEFVLYGDPAANPYEYPAMDVILG